MFKKLRNKLLIVNTLIIAALLLGSFSVIYVSVSQNTTRNINTRLDRALNYAGGNRIQRMGGNIRPEGERRPEDMIPPEESERSENMDNEFGERRGIREIPPEENDEALSLTFTVVTDTEGNVIEENIPFDMSGDFYSDRLPSIVSAAKDRGYIKADGSHWAYKTARTENGYIVAFTDVSAVHTILRNLLIVLLLVALVALLAAFLIGLLSANSSIRPVEESYNKQKQFVADASHELKTPLTTINTNVDVLLSHEDSTIREERKWLDYIKTETERMTKLTNDLLYLARLDHSEDNNVITSRVSFSEAAESVILLMEAVVFEKNINMTYDIAPDLYVNGSAEQLKQVVMILLDNAVKYTQKSGDIEIKLCKDASDVKFTIRNTGEGISDEAQKHIFERFYREDKSRARESGGYGLGLAIAHAIVETHRGSIKVASEKNKYTKFTVKIPSAR